MIKALAVYPGTFDPLTFGHENLVLRASNLFEKLIVAVAENRNKQPFFSLDERFHMAKDVLSKYPNVHIIKFNGLLQTFLESVNAKIILRGLRALSDFEYEFQMAGMNRQLMPNVETIFLTPSDQYQFISGTMVREIAQLNGDISNFVAPIIAKKLRHRFTSKS